MNSLAPDYVQYVRSGIEFIINSTNGEVFFTDAGYCKLSGIPIGRVLDRLDKMQEGTDWHDTQIYTTDGKKNVRVIPAETIFDWLPVDRPTLDRPILAAKFARETSAVSVCFYRLAGNTINRVEFAKSIVEGLEQREKEIKLLKEQAKETVEKVKAQEIESLRNQEAANRLAERAAIKLTTNKNSDDGLEDYLTVWQYLEDIGENSSLNDAIQINDAAIIFCQNRDIEMREIIRNKLGTVLAFPVSVLKQLDKKRKTVFDHENEHYFTISTKEDQSE